jgi:hypothetical protein
MDAKAVFKRNEENGYIQVTLRNPGNVAAIQTKLTLLNAGSSQRILRAYYQDNYISLLPGETREIASNIRYRPEARAWRRLRCVIGTSPAKHFRNGNEVANRTT